MNASGQDTDIQGILNAIRLRDVSGAILQTVSVSGPATRLT